MTDKEVEDIIRLNMMLTMDFAGIRADFEEKLQRTWVGLTDAEIALIDWESLVTKKDCVQAIEAKLKEKNA